MRTLFVLTLATYFTAIPLNAQKRAFSISDLYQIKSIEDPQFSPDGKRIATTLEGHTTRFKALASMMGVYDLPAMHGSTEELWFPEYDLGGRPWDSDLYETNSPNKFVKNFKTPCLVITDEQDLRVSNTQSLEFYTDLQEMGVPSRLIVFKNDGHWPSNVKSMPFYYNAHLDWFHRYLGGAPAPYDMVKMWRNQAYEKSGSVIQSSTSEKAH